MNWLITGAAGFGVLFLSTLAFILWIYASDVSIYDVGFSIFAFIPAYLFFLVVSFVWILVAMIVSITFSTLLGLAILIWTKDYSYLKSTIGSILRNGEYLSTTEELWEKLVEGFIPLLLLVSVTYVFYLIESALKNDENSWWASLITTIDNHVLDIPISLRVFDYGTIIFSSVGILIVMIQVIALLRPRNRKRLSNNWSSYFEGSFMMFQLAGLSLLCGGIFYFAISGIPYLEDVSASWLLQTLVAILGILLAVATICTLFFILSYMWKHHTSSLLTRTAYSTPSAFKNAMELNDTVNKLLFLNQFGPTELGISAEEYFKLLIDVEDHVDEEPALSRYYQRRIEIEEIIRQERHG